MNFYFNAMMGLVPIVFFLSIAGFIYSLIKKKAKLPWLLGIIGAFAFLSFMIVFDDQIIDKIDLPKEKLGDSKDDAEGTIRVRPGKYIVGEDEIKAGVYDLSFPQSGNLNILASDQIRDFHDTKAFNDLEKSRIYLSDGDGVHVTGFAVLVPAALEKMNYEEVDVYSGIWLVGETIAPGKYKTKDIKSFGNIDVIKADGTYGYSGTAEEGMEIELFEGDVITFKGIMLKLTPTD